MREVDPELEIHFAPTSLSWLNLVERFFGQLTQPQIHRLAVTSVEELITAIEAYVNHRNRRPKPFVWTASVQQILTKIDSARRTLEIQH